VDISARKTWRSIAKQAVASSLRGTRAGVDLKQPKRARSPNRQRENAKRETEKDGVMSLSQKPAASQDKSIEKGKHRGRSPRPVPTGQIGSGQRSAADRSASAKKPRQPRGHANVRKQQKGCQDEGQPPVIAGIAGDRIALQTGGGYHKNVKIFIRRIQVPLFFFFIWVNCRRKIYPMVKTCRAGL